MRIDEQFGIRRKDFKTFEKSSVKKCFRCTQKPTFTNKSKYCLDCKEELRIEQKRTAERKQKVL